MRAAEWPRVAKKGGQGAALLIIATILLILVWYFFCEGKDYVYACRIGRLQRQELDRDGQRKLSYMRKELRERGYFDVGAFRNRGQSSYLSIPHRPT